MTYQDFSVFVAKLNITFWKNFELIRNVIAHEGKDIDALSILQHKTNIPNSDLYAKLGEWYFNSKRRI
jgi:hypothetical protein